MSEARTVQLLTAEEFAALPDDGRRLQLIDGRVDVKSLNYAIEGFTSGNLMGAIGQWVQEHRSGYWATARIGVIVSRGPDTVLAPDGTVYTRERLPSPRLDGWPEVAPDLLFEVFSASYRPGEMLLKVGRWLEAGTRVVWVAWPKTQRVSIYGPGDEMTVLGLGDTLTCDSLLPGFALPIDQVFSA